MDNQLRKIGLWSLADYLERNFPQVHIRQLISKEEAEAAIGGQGSYFPKPQSCSAMHDIIKNSEQGPATTISSQSTEQSGALKSNEGAFKSSINENTSPKTQAVLIVGDAVHCFPPDLGQVSMWLELNI